MIIFNQEDLSLVCKHKHMLENGAPLDSMGVLYHVLLMKFYG